MVSLKVAQSDPMPPRETHLGSLGLSKVTSKWSENDTKRHFGNWWRPHWANPIIYYVFGGSLLEKRIIYYVLACSKKLIFMKLYKNLIIYYVLKPPKKSASPKSRPIGCPPLPQTPSPWDTPFCTQRPSQDSESPSLGHIQSQITNTNTKLGSPPPKKTTTTSILGIEEPLGYLSPRLSLHLLTKSYKVPAHTWVLTRARTCVCECENLRHKSLSCSRGGYISQCSKYVSSCESEKLDLHPPPEPINECNAFYWTMYYNPQDTKATMTRLITHLHIQRPRSPQNAKSPWESPARSRLSKLLLCVGRDSIPKLSLEFIDGGAKPSESIIIVDGAIYREVGCCYICSCEKHLDMWGSCRFGQDLEVKRRARVKP